MTCMYPIMQMSKSDHKLNMPVVILLVMEVTMRVTIWVMVRLVLVHMVVATVEPITKDTITLEVKGVAMMEVTENISV